MNTNRLLGEGKSFYHCVSRTVDRKFWFEGSQEREMIRKTMRKLEAFLSVRVVTYCIMSNHVHLLLEVPDRTTLEPVSEKALLDLLPSLYDRNFVQEVEQELQRAREQGGGEEVVNRRIAAILGRFEARRGDLSVFMKEFKHRVTRYINKKHHRRGTLWESRFKSVLVEGNEGALLTMAAYIDLNPVRAGMATRPEDYRWCGYAEALSGNKQARHGLGSIMSESLMDEAFKSDWRRTHNRYRLFLYSEGREVEPNPETGQPGRRGFSADAVEDVEKQQGALSLPEVLRHRVRYFCDGAVLGTAAFVNAVFERHRERFGPAREDGARRMRGAQWGELRVLRNLQRDVIT